MLIELSIFHNCHTSSYGGGVWMSNQGSCVINKCCSNDCSCEPTSTSTTTQGQFLYTDMTNDANHLNKVLDSSVINSTPDKGTSWGTLWLYYAIITINTVNLSRNTCSSYCPIKSAPLIDTSKETSFIHYCSITSNEATNAYAIYLEMVDSRHQLKNSNIINNTINSNGVIYAAGPSKVEECTILANKAPNTFYTYDSTSSFTIINCTIDSTDLTAEGPGQLITDNWSPSPKEFINAIKCT